MPIRVRSQAQAMQQGERDGGSPAPSRDEFALPDITDDDDFRHIVRKLSVFFRDVIELPSTFEQLRTTTAGNCLRVLVDHLTESCSNPAIVNALLALKWHYDADKEGQSLSESRSFACEIVAWRFLTRLSERDAVTYCLYEIADPRTTNHEEPASRGDEEAGEQSPLLPRVFPGNGDCAEDDNSVDEYDDYSTRPVGSSSKRSQLLKSVSRLTSDEDYDDDNDEDGGGANDPTASFRSLNALEIAAIANAKRFLSQHVVQKIITGIWNGDIIFWDSLSVHTTKSPRFYSPATADTFSRLRVPKYLKIWEVLFFAVFLCLYYTVLIVRADGHLSASEVALMVWIGAFAYEEFSEWLDAGSVFYATDIWNVCDVIMISLGAIFAILRTVGVMQQSKQINDLAFNVLALEALFMVPRICSILSLSPSWGVLIPCLKEMTVDFLKYMVIIIIIYCGFLTTFSLIGRDLFSFARMAGILGKIFFGSSYVGFEVMHDIDPVFGPPLMILFITLSSFLLMGSLTGMLSNSFSRVMAHAKEEYLYVYSVYVLEASTSNRLTHFYPPFNLLAFVVFRPWRLVFKRDETFRRGRIWLLRVTHVPIVAAIRVYEMVTRKHGAGGDGYAGLRGPSISRNLAIGGGGSAGTTTIDSGKRGRRQQRSVSKSIGERRTGLIWRESTAVEDDVTREEDGVYTAALEAQVVELGEKIDVLTAMVMAMQNGGGGEGGEG